MLALTWQRRERAGKAICVIFLQMLVVLFCMLIMDGLNVVVLLLFHFIYVYSNVYLFFVMVLVEQTWISIGIDCPQLCFNFSVFCSMRVLLFYLVLIQKNNKSVFILCAKYMSNIDHFSASVQLLISLTSHKYFLKKHIKQNIYNQIKTLMSLRFYYVCSLKR